MCVRGKFHLQEKKKFPGKKGNNNNKKKCKQNSSLACVCVSACTSVNINIISRYRQKGHTLFFFFATVTWHVFSEEENHEEGDILLSSA